MDIMLHMELENDEYVLGRTKYVPGLVTFWISPRVTRGIVADDSLEPLEVLCTGTLVLLLVLLPQEVLLALVLLSMFF